jgi:hypothetical protein
MIFFSIRGSLAPCSALPGGALPQWQRWVSMGIRPDLVHDSWLVQVVAWLRRRTIAMAAMWASTGLGRQ